EAIGPGEKRPSGGQGTYANDLLPSPRLRNDRISVAVVSERSESALFSDAVSGCLWIACIGCRDCWFGDQCRLLVGAGRSRNLELPGLLRLVAGRPSRRPNYWGSECTLVNRDCRTPSWLYD